MNNNFRQNNLTMENNTSRYTVEFLVTWLDWTTIGTLLAASAGVGIYYRFTGGQQKSAEEYFSANRSIGAVMLSFDMVIVYLSGTSMLIFSGETYSNGTIFFGTLFGIIFGTPIISYFYLPVFYKLKMMSVYEYLEQRFGVTTKLVSSIATFILLNFYMGVILYAPALALQYTIGLNATASILLVGLICTFYSTIGGMKAIISNDIAQGVHMLICTFSIIGVVLNDFKGDIPNILDIIQKGGRFNSNFDFDLTIQYTWWSVIIGGTIHFLSSFGCGQVQVQRLLTAKSLGDARKALWMQLPINITTMTIFTSTGLILYAYYFDCDPITNGEIPSYDMITPYFAEDRMAHIPGLIGIFVAGIFSGSLTLISAMLNSLAAIALTDYVKPLYRRSGHEFPEEKATFYGQILSAILGLVALSIAFLASTFGSLVQTVITMNEGIAGSVLGLFTLGMCTEFTNEMGAIAGIVTAIAGNLLWVFLPKPSASTLPMSTEGCSNTTYYNYNPINGTDDDPSSYFYVSRFSYLWISPLGMFAMMTIGMTVSFIFQKCSKTSSPILDINLFTPILAMRIKRRRENEINSSQLFILDSRNLQRSELYV